VADTDPQISSQSAATVSVHHPVPDVAVVAPVGEIDIATAEVLADRIEEAERNGLKALVIDLNGLSFMDSSGLRVIISALKRSEEAGRRFALLCEPDRSTSRLLEISGVGLMTQVAANLDEFLAEFGSD
jgi:anti-sigma B factor antagonist